MFVRSTISRPRRRIAVAAVTAGVLGGAAFFASTTVQGFVYVSKGSSGSDVKCVQKALNTWAAGKNVTPLLDVDGDFGAKTKARVKEYQEVMRLDRDGVVGYSTSRSLAYFASGKCKTRLDEMRPNEPLLYKTGSSGQSVLCLQKAFNGWVDEENKDADPISEDGLFGPETEAAVKYYQQEKKLKITGVAGRETLHDLRYYDRSVACTPYFG